MPETVLDIQDSESVGFQEAAINVMMNGVPYNDSESQELFVNVPDLTSSASQILIQEGVGTQ
jgi:iron complex outermembrane receptor protein